MYGNNVILCCEIPLERVSYVELLDFVNIEPVFCCWKQYHLKNVVLKMSLRFCIKCSICQTSSGFIQQLAAGRPSHTVWLFRPRSQSHSLHQAERSSHTHHWRRLRVSLWDGAGRSLWVRYSLLHTSYKSLRLTVLHIGDLIKLVGRA